MINSNSFSKLGFKRLSLCKKHIINEGRKNWVKSTGKKKRFPFFFMILLCTFKKQTLSTVRNFRFKKRAEDIEFHAVKLGEEGFFLFFSFPHSLSI